MTKILIKMKKQEKKNKYKIRIEHWYVDIVNCWSQLSIDSIRLVIASIYFTHISPMAYYSLLF